jgi:glycosyltransferase involved in cell wall biosynthesis
MKKNYSVSFILPVYNEEESIGEILDNINNFLSVKDTFTRYEIIVVNDGSYDDTAKVLEGHLHKIPHLRVVTHSKNLGYGNALISGIKNSRFPLVFFMDADRQFDIAGVSDMFSVLEDSDMIIGYRDKRKDKLRRIILARFYGWLVFLFFGLKVKDVNCGFKLFRKEIFNDANIFSRAGVFYTEILLKALKRGYAIKEAPVRHFPRVSGKQTGASFRVIFEAIIDFSKLYIKEKLRR